MCSAANGRKCLSSWRGSLTDAEVIACSCLSVCACVWFTWGSVCGRHAYTVTGPAADSRATIGPDSEIEDLGFMVAKKTRLLFI